MYVHNKASNNALFKTYIERVFKDNLSNHFLFWYLIVVVIYLHITLQVAVAHNKVSNLPLEVIKVQQRILNS